MNLPIRGVREHFKDFYVMVSGQETVGVIGMEVYGRQALLRSLGVKNSYQGMGYGKQLCGFLLERMRERGIDEVFLLTRTAEPFFSKIGFETVSRDKAGARVKSSVEFQSVCPASAVCMMRKVK